MVDKDKQLMVIIQKELNKKKVAIVVLLLILLICSVLVIRNYIQKINSYKAYKQYEEQLQTIASQKEQVQAKNDNTRNLPVLTEKAKAEIENIYHSDSKRVFITFDDGPSTVTPQILDTLKQENVKATFFVLGSRVEAQPDMVKRMYEEGHFIANHGYSHKYTAIYQSPQTVLDEFNKCNEAVQKAIQVPEYNSHLFRFPGGVVGGKYAGIKSQAAELLKQNNIMYVDWNALTGDAETNNLSVELEIKRLQETISGRNSVVLLMHDAQAKTVTAEALPQIISYLRGQGYEFKNFYDIMNI